MGTYSPEREKFGTGQDGARTRAGGGNFGTGVDNKKGARGAPSLEVAEVRIGQRKRASKADPQWLSCGGNTVVSGLDNIAKSPQRCARGNELAVGAHAKAGRSESAQLGGLF